MRAASAEDVAQGVSAPAQGTIASFSVADPRAFEPARQCRHPLEIQDGQ